MHDDVFCFHQQTKLSRIFDLQEHIIFALNDETVEFHNRLALSYRDKVVKLIREFQDSLPEGLSRMLHVQLHNADNKLTGSCLKLFGIASSYIELVMNDSITVGLIPTEVAPVAKLLHSLIFCLIPFISRNFFCRSYHE